MSTFCASLGHVLLHFLPCLGLSCIITYLDTIQIFDQKGFFSWHNSTVFGFTRHGIYPVLDLDYLVIRNIFNSGMIHPFSKKYYILFSSEATKGIVKPALHETRKVKCIPFALADREQHPIRVK